MFEKDEIKEFFKENSVVTVTFTKKNGDSRVMHCTTNINKIPEEQKPTGASARLNEDIMRVFDIEKQEWRSFRFDSVTNIE